VFDKRQETTWSVPRTLASPSNFADAGRLVRAHASYGDLGTGVISRPHGYACAAAEHGNLADVSQSIGKGSLDQRFRRTAETEWSVGGEKPIQGGQPISHSSFNEP
jgi:hypothetical protein